ncbi:MAG TPA: 1,4-alpha-glucan branching protein GlgB [Acidimicrobiales bacterium]|nr:1,4-alpha-glucan branching protein GlgB [Acidimicrobiales bacterium]
MGRPLTDLDRWTFNEGSHTRLHEVLGAHVDDDGTWFRVWAPNAEAVTVIGDFNGWEPARSAMTPGSTGIWETFVPGAAHSHHYKFQVTPRGGGRATERADPHAFRTEAPPRTASIVWDMSYTWRDAEWMATRAERNSLESPISVYEIHLGSWSRSGDQDYRGIAPRLADHVRRCGFTHVEFLPLMEHPFYGSWGYQTTAFFAPTARYGAPQDLMFLIDYLHQRGIGVILDWVPSHFPGDEFALARFDGTHLYEHADPRLGFHPDWNSLIFNYDRHEVRSFLLSSAHFWLDRYHADGLRVDAVASMLYRDYSRSPGEWVPNEQGGRENLGAIQFLRQLNESVYREFPGVQTYAEESTAWPMVSRPTDVGGLGFGFKWDMGWMHDTLRYLRRDPIYRAHHHGELTFRGVYAFSENFILPLSHDEVVHGKGSLLSRQPGDRWQQLAGLRLLYGYQYGLPGKKLLFMGAELAQEIEWNHDTELSWWLLQQPEHEGIRQWVADLNAVYRSERSLHQYDCDPSGFAWIEPDDARHSVLAFVRRSDRDRPVVVVANFTPVPRRDYRVGVPIRGAWVEILNSDAEVYGGGGVGNLGRVVADYVPWHGHELSVSLSLPPLGVLFLVPAQKSP